MHREKLLVDSTQRSTHTWSKEDPDPVILAHTLQLCILLPLHTENDLSCRKA